MSKLSKSATKLLDAAIKRGSIPTSKRRAVIEYAARESNGSEEIGQDAIFRAISKAQRGELVSESETRSDDPEVVCEPVIACRRRGGRFVKTPEDATGKAREFSLGSLRGVRGGDCEIHYPTGTAKGRASLSGFFALLPMDQVISSHDPHSFERTDPKRYPKHLQERDYFRDTAERRKVIDNSRPAGFEPGIILADTPTAIDGPPVIDYKGRVLGGSSRAMIVARALGYPSARARYFKALDSDAACFGLIGWRDVADNLDIEPETLELVRVVDIRGIDERAISRALNRPLTQWLAPESEAPALGRLLSAELLELLGDPDLTLKKAISVGGEELALELRRTGVITRQNEAQWLKKRHGEILPELSKRGRERLFDAVMGALIDDPEVLAGTPTQVVDLYGRIAPYILRIHIEKGLKAWDVLEALRTASQDVPRLDYLARIGGLRSIKKYLKQPRLELDPLAVDGDPYASRFLYWIWSSKTRRVDAADRARDYLREALEQLDEEDEQPGLFEADSEEAAEAVEDAARAQVETLGLAYFSSEIETSQEMLLRLFSKKEPENPSLFPGGGSLDYSDESEDDDLSYGYSDSDSDTWESDPVDAASSGRRAQEIAREINESKIGIEAEPDTDSGTAIVVLFEPSSESEIGYLAITHGVRLGGGAFRYPELIRWLDPAPHNFDYYTAWKLERFIARMAVSAEDGTAYYVLPEDGAEILRDEAESLRELEIRDTDQGYVIDIGTAISIMVEPSSEGTIVQYGYDPERFRGNPDRGENPGGEWETQSVLIPRSDFTLRQARAWLSNHDYRSDDYRREKEYYRFRQADPDLFTDYGQIPLPNGVVLLRGRA